MVGSLVEQIRKKKSLLCVGLDSDIQKIPKFLLAFEDPIFEFNKRIIDATADIAVAYKPNFAFYEALGSKGWDTLKKTVDYIPQDIFTIADAKRGDIGNTASYYAQAVFDQLGFDSITVAPYMGHDSITPFLAHKNKVTIVLGLTSNPGSTDFQKIKLLDQTYVYQEVIKKVADLAPVDQMMFVVGATQGAEIKEVRKIVPEHFLLVPGVGAQGGSLKDVITYGLTKQFGLLINASRNILYVSDQENFDQHSRIEALKIVQEMRTLVKF